MTTMDLSTKSRSKQRDETMLQHPIYLYQIHRLGKHGGKGPDDDDHSDLVELLEEQSGPSDDWLWRHDRVFATYEEAQAYGRSNRHNDGDEGIGWRVWALPAMGALRGLLDQALAP